MLGPDIRPGPPKHHSYGSPDPKAAPCGPSVSARAGWMTRLESKPKALTGSSTTTRRRSGDGRRLPQSRPGPPGQRHVSTEETPQRCHRRRDRDLATRPPPTIIITDLCRARHRRCSKPGIPCNASSADANTSSKPSPLSQDSPRTEYSPPENEPKRDPHAITPIAHHVVRLSSRGGNRVRARSRA